MIVATVQVLEGDVRQYGHICMQSLDEAYWLLIFGACIPLLIVFLFNWVIITKIVVLLHRVMATIPDDMDDAAKIKRHYKFVAYHTLMFIFTGIFCWGVLLITLFSHKFWRIPYQLAVLHFVLNPLQGFV